MTVVTPSGVEQTGIVHPDARRLLQLWNRWRGAQPIPSRSAMNLQEMGALLPFMMVLERNPVQPLFRLRLAGTALRRFTGRELTGVEFSTLWPEHDRDLVVQALSSTISHLGCHIFLVAGATRSGRQAAFQCVFLPVRVDGRQTVQVLGGLFPLNDPYWFDKHPITSFRLLGGKTLDTEPFGDVEKLVSRA